MEKGKYKAILRFLPTPTRSPFDNIYYIDPEVIRIRRDNTIDEILKDVPNGR
tara:strand:- start:1866 stop:2021 length:156 start_codon:yes stop_codon:yes gene_type:complete